MCVCVDASARLLVADAKTEPYHTSGAKRASSVIEMDESAIPVVSGKRRPSGQ